VARTGLCFVQSFKKMVGHRAVSRPKVHFAQQLLLGEAMELMRGTGTVKPLHEVLTWAMHDYSKSVYDTPADSVLLRGVGRPIDGALADVAEPLLQVRS